MPKTNSMALTLAMIERLKPGEKTPTDAAAPGLYAKCNLDGSVSWRFLRKASGQPKPIQRTYGTTREFTLPEARAWALDLSRQIVAGVDLNAVREAAIRDEAAERAAATIEAARQANTFESVWLQYITSITDKQAAKTIEMKRSRMKNNVLPAIGSKPITDVTLDDLWSIAQAKVDAGFETASNHIVADIKAFYSWCQSHGRHIAKLNGANPSTHLKKLGDEGERTRFIDAWELPLFVRAMAEMDQHDRRLLTLMLLTGQRLSNVQTAAFDQWQPETDAWVIMAMKGKKKERVPNVLPLGAWGRTLFTTPAPTLGRKCVGARPGSIVAARKRAAQYLFPAIRGEGPRSGHMRSLCDELVERMQSHAPVGRTIERIMPHDFRRTLISNGERLGLQTKHLQAVVGHREGGILKHYQMYRFLPEKAHVLSVWEAEITRVAREAGVADALGIPREGVKLALVA